LEFPGGAVDPGDHTLKAGFLKELKEETEIPDQKVWVYMRNVPCFAQGADLALENKVCVAFLTNMKFEHYVKTDGGLNVVSLSPKDVQENIWMGNIRSIQGSLLGWAFYLEVQKALLVDTMILFKMLETGYLDIMNVNLG
jgi:ADP-ribose pyrophosphatase YjhB (NUDIX family)